MQTDSIGVMYEQTDGGNGTVIWAKNSGSGNTGWKVMQLGLGIFNVMDYGAKGDGSTDDTTAVQAAADAAAVNGGVVYFPQGGYSISGISLTAKNNIVFAGAGQESAKLLMRGSTDTALLLFTRCNWITIRDLWLYGNNVSGADGPSGSAVYFDATTATAALEGLVVRDCVIENFKGAGWLRVQNPGNYDVTKVWFLDNVLTGGSDRDPSNIGVASAQLAFRLPNYLDPTAASSGTTTTTTKTGAGWSTNAYQNKYYKVHSGTGAGQLVQIASNTSDTLTFVSAVATPADGTTQFAITGIGSITDVIVRGNLCKAANVKQGVSCIGQSSVGIFSRIMITGNQVIDAGQANAGVPVQGAYGIILYGGNNGGIATNCVVSSNVVKAAYTCGVYMTSSRTVRVAENLITDQVDTSDTTLPRAGIATLDVTTLAVVGNTLRDCAYGIQVANNTDLLSLPAVNVNISGNVVAGGQRGILLRYGGATAVSGYVVNSNTVTGQSAEGISLKYVDGTTAANDLVCSGNTVVASSSPSSTYQGIGGGGKDVYGARWVVTGNTVDCGGASSGSAYQLGNATTVGISSGRVAGNCAYHAGAYGFSLLRAYVDVVDNVVDTCGTGTGTGAFRTRDARGSFYGNRVISPPASTFIIESSAGEDLGLDTPTWTGNQGTTIQTQSPTSGQQWGWVCTTGSTWKGFGTLA